MPKQRRREENVDQQHTWGAGQGEINGAMMMKELFGEKENIMGATTGKAELNP